LPDRDLARFIIAKKQRRSISLGRFEYESVIGKNHESSTNHLGGLVGNRINQRSRIQRREDCEEFLEELVDFRRETENSGETGKSWETFTNFG